MNDQNKALVFANARAGGAKRALGPAVARLQERGMILERIEVDLRPESISEALKEAAVDFVIAFGGDGTIGGVIDAVAGTDITLGVLPAGTSNNFARSLGIPMKLRSAIDVLVDGRKVRIDVGRANGHYFGHGAIMGLNVDFARKAQKLRGRIGRLSYPLASVMVYRKRKSIHVTVRSGDSERHIDAFQIAILNSGEYGGWLGLEVPNIDLQDHKLRLLAVEDLRFRTMLVGLPKIFFRRHMGLPGALEFDFMRGTIETEEPEEVTLDGEIKTHSPLEVEIVPNAVTVMIPRGPR